jgi:hypothetical protein
MSSEADFPVLKPDLQISLFTRLQSLRKLYLGEALKATVEKAEFELAKLDAELSALVPAPYLKRLAGAGLRGEIFFPVPYMLGMNPFLVGYYRLLFGLSQKAFYEQGPFAGFKRIEERGAIPSSLQPRITALCKSLITTAEILLDGIELLGLDSVNDLQLLTLGPQLRGSRNVDVGQAAVETLFDLFKGILATYAPTIKRRSLKFMNDSGLVVSVHFGADPDVSITQQLGSQDRKLVAIEIKGGIDVSNIWNRLGEAEKSHSTAKRQGFNELWTITGVDLDATKATAERAKQKSASTTRFFFLARIVDGATAEGAQFRQLLGSVMGVRLEP